MDFGITVVGFQSSILEKGVVDQAIKRSPKDIYVSMRCVFSSPSNVAHGYTVLKGSFFLVSLLDLDIVEIGFSWIVNPKKVSNITSIQVLYVLCCICLHYID